MHMNECHQETSKKKLKTCDKPEECEGSDKTDPWDRQPDSSDDSNQCNQFFFNI